MNRAMTVVMNNQNRDPNNLIANKKRPPPIKFYRSVGLQVSIEPATRSSIAKVIHMSNTNGYAFNGLKQANGSNTPAKRPGPKSMTDPSVVRSGNGLNKTVATGLTHMNGHLSTSPTKPLSIPSINKQVATPTVVDLTDDSPSENQGKGQFFFFLMISVSLKLPDLLSYPNFRCVQQVALVLIAW